MEKNKVTKYPIMILDDFSDKATKNMVTYEKLYPNDEKFKYRFFLKITPFNESGCIEFSGVNTKMRSLDGLIIFDDANTYDFASLSKRVYDVEEYKTLRTSVLENVSVQYQNVPLEGVGIILSLLKTRKN